MWDALDAWDAWDARDARDARDVGAGSERSDVPRGRRELPERGTSLRLLSTKAMPKSSLRTRAYRREGAWRLPRERVVGAGSERQQRQSFKAVTAKRCPALTTWYDFRMGAPRLPREAYQGEVACAFTARVHGWKKAFTEAETVEPLVHELERSMVDAGCFVPAYCFMPDHLHVMFSGWTQTSDTWLAMVLFKSRTGQALYEMKSD